jgi:hypothetical protein
MSIMMMRELGPQDLEASILELSCKGISDFYAGPDDAG